MRQQLLSKIRAIPVAQNYKFVPNVPKFGENTPLSSFESNLKVCQVEQIREVSKISLFSPGKSFQFEMI